MSICKEIDPLQCHTVLDTASTTAEAAMTDRAKQRPRENYGVSLAKCHPTQANTSRLKPQPVKAGTRFTYPEGTQG